MPAQTKYAKQDKIRALNAIHENLELLWDSIEDLQDKAARDRGRLLYEAAVEDLSELDFLLDPR